MENIKGPTVPGTHWAPTYAEPRFSTFTRCFPHPEDRGRPDADTRQRFLEDHSRYPVPHYGEHNLLWKGSRWRTLSAKEREELMGFPLDYTSKLHGNQVTNDSKGDSVLEDARCSALCNTFHSPSIVLFLALIFQLPQVPGALGIDDQVPDRWAEQHARHSLWGEKNLRDLTPQISAETVLDDMLTLFPDGFFDPLAVLRVRAGSQELDIRPLLGFHVWSAQQGVADATRGADLTALQNRSRHQTAMQQQRNMPGCRTTDAQAIEEGLTPAQHMEAALQMDHSYTADPLLEHDLAYAVEGISRLGPDVGEYRSKIMDLLRKIKRWLEPLERIALAARPGHPVGHMPPTFCWVLHRTLQLERPQLTDEARRRI